MNSAVRLEFREKGQLAIVAMEDHAARNAFSKELVCGLGEAFSTISSQPGLKAVVIHGYGPVFCAGGTLEELLAIADKKLSFEAGGFYRLLLDCPVPVIAAMQGHALGGGLVFGLYADIIVLSRESVYCANFMKYGFTPGMGATLIIPERFGNQLGNEMLFTAAALHGGDLEKRGANVTVAARDQVIPKALELARELVDKPELSLRLLKQRMSAGIKQRLPAVEAEERAMHEKTFAQPGVRERIQTRFGV